MIKRILRSVLLKLPFSVTQNIKYDQLSTKILQQILRTDSNCIDIGCHKGEFLDEMIKFAPKGKHIGFEPIPDFYKVLQTKYSSNNNIILRNEALSDEVGETTFNYVKSSPAYSGLKKREYKSNDEQIEEILVLVQKLDEVVPRDWKVDLIKIDVEGGELQVLKGATRILESQKPTIIFEHGLGASEFYGTTPKELYRLLVDQSGLQIRTLSGFLKKSEPLTLSALETLYNNRKEYYFIASAK